VEETGVTYTEVRVVTWNSSRMAIGTKKTCDS